MKYFRLKLIGVNSAYQRNDTTLCLLQLRFNDNHIFLSTRDFNILIRVCSNNSSYAESQKIMRKMRNANCITVVLETV